MGSYLQKATEMHSLRTAWQRIRENGVMSPSSDTRDAVEIFGRDAERNLAKIQRRLRDGAFEFEPQTGVLKKKSNGKFRGIVMASVHNRVVERAWLDCLQTRSDYVRSVIEQPTSVGGVPHRSVPHGLKLIDEAMEGGKRFFVRSDISGFFDHIPRQDVIAKIGEHIDDPSFIKVLVSATTVVLKNEVALGENRKSFPTDAQGVAQGSPLSPLFGNILLQEFDNEFNARGIVCIRFIDDFVLMGRSQGDVNKAFESASRTLRALGLKCHDPFSGASVKDKAAHGCVDAGFDFLGYSIGPGLFQPSRQSRKRLLGMVDDHIRHGRLDIDRILNEKGNAVTSQRYAQTLVKVDRVLRGWGDAFSYTTTKSTIMHLDEAISSKLDDFRSWFSRQIAGCDYRDKRRIGGVCLLEDVPSKTFADVPFIIPKSDSFVRRSNTVTVSTDGALAHQQSRRARDAGPGGWAYVVHDSTDERSGHSLSTTNNQMELRAVIEALKGTDPKKPLVIRTDSQYVSNAFNNQTTMKTNRVLWDEFQRLCVGRKLKIVWIKGHNNDPQNDRADALAAKAASIALAECGLPKKGAQ